MIRILYRHRSGTIVSNLPENQLAAAARDPQCRLWIDMMAPTPEEYTLVLEKTFNFHPLSIEDAIKDVHVPKVDDYGQYLYLVFHTFLLGKERMDIDTNELDVFLGANFLVTIHGEPRPSIDKIWEEDFHRSHGLARGSAFLLYELLDRQIDGYIPLFEQFEERIEELGDLIFHKPTSDENAILNDILTAKSSALRLRRILSPQRELLKRLAWNDYTVIPGEVRIYFQDVYDHLVRLTDLADSMRDLISSTIETHLALANNRMNEIMKVLTIISTTFIPLSFLASIYGMTFEYMPELGMRWTYPLMWLIFIGVGVTMLWFFRRRKWL
jgi:magnesium transporter